MLQGRIVQAAIGWEKLETAEPPSLQLKERPPCQPQRSSPPRHGRLHGQGRWQRRRPHEGAGCTIGRQQAGSDGLGSRTGGQGFFLSIPAALLKSPRRQRWPGLCHMESWKSRVQEAETLRPRPGERQQRLQGGEAEQGWIWVLSP